MYSPLDYFLMSYQLLEQLQLCLKETNMNLRHSRKRETNKVHTDYKNLVHESEVKTSQRVMRQRLLLEEFGPEIVYI